MKRLTFVHAWRKYGEKLVTKPHIKNKEKKTKRGQTFVKIVLDSVS